MENTLELLFIEIGVLVAAILLWAFIFRKNAQRKKKLLMEETQKEAILVYFP